MHTAVLKIDLVFSQGLRAVVPRRPDAHLAAPEAIGDGVDDGNTRVQEHPLITGRHDGPRSKDISVRHVDQRLGGPLDHDDLGGIPQGDPRIGGGDG